MTDVVALRPQPDALNLISLCTGGGGLDRAVELAIPAARPVVCVERESFSVASLVAQIENGLMAPAAVWSNVRTFNGRRFRGLVDGLIGGIPCQGHSLAGRRQGSHDERDLWSPARRIIAQARPWFVLIENVGGMLSAGADEVAGAQRVRRDLRKLGYSVTLVIVRADQMGLPHERLRVFILGVADWFVADRSSVGDQRWGIADDLLRTAGEAEEDGQQRQRCGCSADGCGCGMADARGDGREGALAAGETPAKRRRSANVSPTLADGIGPGLEGRGSSGDRSWECSAAERSGEHLADANVVELRRIPPAGEQPLVQQDDGVGRPDQLDDAAGGDGRLHAGPGFEGIGAAHARGSVEVVDAVGGGRPGRSEGALGRPLGRTDEQRLADGHGAEPASERRDASEVRRLSEGEGRSEHGAALSGGGRPFLRPPGPGDFDAWRHVALVAPELLPAVSRYDRLRLEMGAQGFVADGDPSSGSWVDAQTGARVHSTILQAAVERSFRGVADVMAPRIDELRMLGNGVVDAQGALAVRIGAHDLAARSSAGAALLVRMMGEPA